MKKLNLLKGKMLKKVFFFFFKEFFCNEIINFLFHTKEEKINYEDIYSSIQFKNSEIIIIEMDKPKKEIPILINFNEFSFFINGTLVPENIYNEENSKTFISNNKSKFSYSDILANIGYRTIESFYFKNIKKYYKI